MTILRNAADLQTASMADLLETYNAMSENPVKRFADLTTARRRTEMALLSAADAAGHAGVPANTKPKPETVKEIAARKKASQAGEVAVRAKSAPTPAPSPKKPEKPTKKPKATFGSMAEGLLAAADKSKKPVVRDAAQLPEPRVRLTHVVVTGEAGARLNPNSMRRAVYDWLVSKGKGALAIADLNAHFDGDMRGQVQKLTASKHLRPAAPEEIAKVTK